MDKNDRKTDHFRITTFAYLEKFDYLNQILRYICKRARGMKIFLCNDVNSCDIYLCAHVSHSRRNIIPLFFFSARTVDNYKCRFLFTFRNKTLLIRPRIALFQFLIRHWKSKRQFREIVITRKCHSNLGINDDLCSYCNIVARILRGPRFHTIFP